MSTQVEINSPSAFIRRLGNALLRIVALAIVGAAHWGLEKDILYIVPKNIEAAALWLEDISFCTFCLIYVYLLWDMIKVFIPRLQSGVYPGLKVEEDDPIYNFSLRV